MLDKNNKILIVFTYTYDRLGRVSTLKSGNVTRTMTYDIHGWTTSLKTALSGKTMTEKLYYADSSKPRYNGFVSRRDLDGYSYLYTYNNRGFLTEAKYSGGESGSDYTETFSYNDRGGLLTLKRMGVTDLLPSGSKSYGVLDDISGSYTGNRLTSVTVSTGAQVYDRRTGIRKSGTYSLGYDASGRLTSDGTRGMTSITYNNNGMLTGVRTSTIMMAVTRDGLGRKTGMAMNKFNSTGGLMSSDNRIYTGNGHVVSKNAIVMSRFPGGFFDSAGSPYYYLTDFQGNNIGVYDKTGKLVQRTDYYASGEPWLEPEYGNSASGNRYLFGGKERMAGGALNEYDFEARNYVASFQRFTTIDPEAEKFSWMSPYAYCNGNPINFIDPTGAHTQVTLKSPGVYEVVGGELDDDLNVYLYCKNEDGELVNTGISIGETTSATSFYYSEENRWATESIIDLKDPSGKNFLNKIMKNPPLLAEYVDKARNKQPLDFKVTNGTGELFGQSEFYRGMSIGETKDGKNLITSARDIGNITAGYVAAYNGLSYIEARIGFDGYQSFSNKKIQLEGISTRNAEMYGFNWGLSNSNIFSKTLRRATSFHSSIAYLGCKILR